ncbi:hypothetical protein [Jiangella alkaliphila]|nr:hypothetical protein [Jiangella alkaliphila]
MSTDRAATPAKLRRLVGQAEALAAEIAGVRDRFRADPDESTRLAGFRLDDAAGTAARIAHELVATAGDLARVRGRPTCGADWGVCPVHGNTLRASGGRCWCTVLDCGRSWGYDRLGLPCSEPVAFDVRDTEGGGGPMCAGHAKDAQNRIVGAVVTPLDGPGGEESSR